MRIFSPKRPWGIRTRFIAALTVFTVLLSASFILVTTKQVSDTLHSQLKDRGRMMLLRLAKDVADAYALDDPLEREIRLLVLANRAMLDEALYVQVVLGGKQVVASAEEGWLPPVESQFIEERKFFAGEQFGKRFYDFYNPLPPGEDGPSYVRLGLSLTPLQQQLNELLRSVIFLAVLFIVIGFLVATWLYRRVFRPLNKLLFSVRQLAAGQRDARANITTRDEIQEIADEFNRLADAIEQRTVQLENTNAQLARADQAKSEFLATMSHEWKTPLHSLRGYAQLLLEEVDGPLNPAQREDVEAMLASANHLLALIENILHFIQSEHDETMNYIESLDLARLARQTWHHVRPAARDRAITHYDKLPNTLYMEGDRTRLRQVLINLIGNAVQYTPSGSVTLQGGKTQHTVWLRIEDTGIGIPPDLLNVICEPFQRVNPQRAPDDKNASSARTAQRVRMEGLGLGLTVAQRYIELHHGTITIQSKPGEGTACTIELPIRPPAK